MRKLPLIITSLALLAGCSGAPAATPETPTPTPMIQQETPKPTPTEDLEAEFQRQKDAVEREKKQEERRIADANRKARAEKAAAEKKVAEAKKSAAAEAEKKRITEANRKARAERRAQAERAAKKEKDMAAYGDTCEEIARSFRPHGLPAHFPIRCVKDMEGGGNAGRAPLGSTLVEFHREGDITTMKPTSMEIKDGLDAKTTRGLITHEATHAVSFSWPVEKQKRFLKSLGAKEWLEGDYINQPTERLANQVTHCAGYNYMKNWKGIPGGCKAAAQWMKD